MSFAGAVASDRLVASPLSILSGARAVKSESKLPEFAIDGAWREWYD